MWNRPEVQHSDGGILVHAANAADLAATRHRLLDQAHRLGIANLVETREDRRGVRFRLGTELQRGLAPDYDTQQLCGKLNLDTLANSDDLDKENCIRDRRANLDCLCDNRRPGVVTVDFSLRCLCVVCSALGSSSGQFRSSVRQPQATTQRLLLRFVWPPS